MVLQYIYIKFYYILINYAIKYTNDMVFKTGNTLHMKTYLIFLIYWHGINLQECVVF